MHWTICMNARGLHLVFWRNAIGCQPPTKAKKGVKDLVCKQVGGWWLGRWDDPKTGKGIRVELTRGVPPLHGKKTRPLGKNEVPDIHGALFWGLVIPRGFVGGFVSGPTAFVPQPVLMTRPTVNQVHNRTYRKKKQHSPHSCKNNLRFTSKQNNKKENCVHFS